VSHGVAIGSDCAVQVISHNEQNIGCSVAEGRRKRKPEYCENEDELTVK
jgi:hypothetical protein